MKKSRRTYNGVHLNKKSNTQDVVEQSLTLSRFWLVHLPSFLERLLLTAVRCYGKTVIRTICEIMLLI